MSKVNNRVPKDKAPVLADCHVVNSYGSSQNTKELTKLNSKGQPEPTNLNETVRFVYVSLLIDYLEFKRLNPKFNPKDYE